MRQNWKEHDHKFTILPSTFLIDINATENGDLTITFQPGDNEVSCQAYIEMPFSSREECMMQMQYSRTGKNPPIEILHNLIVRDLCYYIATGKYTNYEQTDMLEYDSELHTFFDLDHFAVIWGEIIYDYATKLLNKNAQK